MNLFNKKTVFAALALCSAMLSAQAKTLVVYYSASGYTKSVANTIAAYVKGDTFELVPAIPYTSDDLNYNNPDSRVSREHDDPNREVKLTKNTVDDFASYDTVFIAYPIWWGIAAWPVDDFVKKMQYSYYTKEALEKDYDKISLFANREGLTAHARAVDIRFGKEDRD